MPITFAQPEPFMPGISAGAGALEQYQRDRQFALQQQHQQAQIEEAARHQQLQEAQFFAGQQPSARDLWLGQQQEQAQQQRVKLHADLQQMELSQKEEMRLQQMKSAVADVQADPNLSQEEKDNASLMLKTGIDRYQQRKSAAQLQHMQMQDQLLQEQTKKQTQLLQQQQEFQAKTLEQRVSAVTDPRTGEQRYFYLDHQGNPKSIFESLDRMERLGAAREQKPIDEVALEKHAIASVKAANAGALTPLSEKDFKEKVQTEVDRLRGMLQQQRGGQGGGQTAQPPPAPPAPAKPFSSREPETQSPEQRQAVAGYIALRHQLAEQIHDPKELRQYGEYVTKAQDLHEKYGSRDAMPSIERAQYDTYLTLLKYAPDESAKKASAAAARGQRAHAADQAKQQRELSAVWEGIKAGKSNEEVQKEVEAIRQGR